MVSTVGPVSNSYPSTASRPARPPGHRLPFQHGDLPAGAGQVQRAGQAAEAGADHDDPVGRAD